MSSGAGIATGSRGDAQGDVRSLRTQVWVLCWFSAVYLPTTAIIAARRYLWNDELFTFYISAQPLRRIWTVLLTGVDQQPPPFHWLTHELLRIFGPSPLAVRLPELAGFWLFGACVIVIVSRRLPPAYGFLGAMLAAVSGAYPYAYEARPYAIVLGLSALAFFCWQRLDDGKGFAWLMAASLAIGLLHALLRLPGALSVCCGRVGSLAQRAPYPVALVDRDGRRYRPTRRVASGDPGVTGICLLGAWALAWAFRARSRPATLAGVFSLLLFRSKHGSRLRLH